MKNTKQFGDIGEEMASEYLSDHGYEIVSRNFRTRYGEIDIIAKIGRQLVFVEVKRKKNVNKGYPAEMVTKKKLQKIVNMANIYLSEIRYTGAWQIDVISILNDKIEHFKNVTSY